jgi:16S rRNA (cytosine1402-N4)-methyltransferase
LKYQHFYEDKKTKWKKEKKFMNATMSLEKTKHYPVMLKKLISIISPQRGGSFIDCTFGGGGYSKAILNFPKTNVIAVDRDKISETKAKKLAEKFPKRFSFFTEKFSNLSRIIEKKSNIHAVIFDLGISSFQLSDKDRGFSFNSEKSLNMEMGINKYSAYDVVNKLDKKHLGNIIKILGEEKDGKKIANKIDIHRKIKPIKTSKELANIINKVKKNYKAHKKNTATQTFQAIRIFVNQELTELMHGLIEATKILPNGGILIVVSFHSLEDRIVKNFFNNHSNLEKNPSRYLPLKENKFNFFKILSKKPLKPETSEIKENPPSRSAKLRYAIRNNNSFLYPKDFENKFANYFNLEGLKI